MESAETAAWDSEPSIPPPDLDLLLTEISRLHPSVEGAVELFDGLKHAFHISKGALLIRNKANEFFLPLAQTGLDVTSRNRLRYPFQSMADSNNGSWISPQEFSVLQPYLSSREYDLIEDMIILSLPGADGPVGMLLILGEEEGCLDYLRALKQADTIRLEEALGQFFRDNKLLLITSSAEDPPSHDELVSFVGRLMEQERELTVIRFNTAPLLKRLERISPDVDLFRARKDTLRIIETLFEGNSKILPLKSEAYLLVLGTNHRQNPKLLQHQVGLALQNFFSDDQTSIEFSPVKLPDQFGSARQLVEDYLLQE